MALQGSAFLALFNDIDPARDHEYNRWHSIEHVPQRLTVPGILRARRYVDRDTTRFPYFTLYEVATRDTFLSAPYLDLLDHPTPWSRSMRPSFRHFRRMPCAALASVGEGIGGNIATIAISGEPGADRAAWASLCQEIAALDGVVGVHAGLEDKGLRGPTGVNSAAPPSDVPANLLLVESLEPDAASRHRARIVAAIEAAFPGAQIGAAIPNYRLMHLITQAHHPEPPA